MNREKSYIPRLIAWEVIRQCTLHCRHCRASAQNIPYQDELTFEECQRVLDVLAEFTPPPIVILTGGDPLMRADIDEIIAYGARRGLRMVIALCGEFLSLERMRRLKGSGILKISFSLDGSAAAAHDAFRGQPGSFDAVLRGIEYAKAAGLPFQVNSTISKLNVNELPDILNLAIQAGADAFHPFLLVPTGKARELIDLELAPDEYEATLRWISAQSAAQPIMVKPTCAPHYYRILRQEGHFRPGPSHAGSSAHAHEHGFSAMTKGCLGGQGFAFISHTGKVQICGFLELECGDLRQEDFAFQRIWENSPLLQEIRDIACYHGKCGVCEFWQVCGGCRARAYSMTGDYLASEPFCTYQPRI